METKFHRVKWQVFFPRLLQAKNLLYPVKTIDKKFLFIMGSGRNGSTLLASILNGSNDIFIPPEQYILPFEGTRWSLSTQKLRLKSKLADAFLDKKKTSNWALLKSDLEELDTMGFQTSIRDIFLAYAKKMGKQDPSILGDNSPLMTHYSKIMRLLFPASFYVFLIRNPYDVAYSYKKLEGHPAQQVDFAIWKWEDSIRQYRMLRKNGELIFLVKYEDLVDKPTEELTKIFDFLGVDFREKYLKSRSSQSDLGVGGLKHHDNLSKPVGNDSIGKGLLNLPSSEISKIKNKLSNLAEEFGYEL